MSGDFRSLVALIKRVQSGGGSAEVLAHAVMDWAEARYRSDSGVTAACGPYEAPEVLAVEHDEKCEADFIEGAYAWTPCRCDERSQEVTSKEEGRA